MPKTALIIQQIGFESASHYTTKHDIMGQNNVKPMVVLI